jgi:hypothetical protein
MALLLDGGGFRVALDGEQAGQMKKIFLRPIAGLAPKAALSG